MVIFKLERLARKIYFLGPVILGKHLSMTMNPLPPQAYTKETLVQAYAWLQSQSEQIKEMATSPDTLVSLFVKAKLQGHSSLERPSIQNFKNELKSLAGMMGEFEVVDQPSENGGPPTVRIRPPERANSEAIRHEARVEKQESRQETRHETRHEIRHEIRHETKQSDELDAHTLTMIQEVKNQFNLSSNTEALRLLVAAGYKRIRDIL